MKRSKCELRGERPSTPFSKRPWTTLRTIAAVVLIATAYVAAAAFLLLAAAPASALVPEAATEALPLSDDSGDGAPGIPEVVDDEEAERLLEEFRARISDRQEELDVLETVRRMKLVEEISKKHAHEDIAEELGDILRNRRHDEKLRAAAARGLGRYGEADEATLERARHELLRAFSREEEPAVLESELRALGALRCEKAVRTIEKRIRSDWSKHDRHTRVLEAAIGALGEIGTYDALDTLYGTWMHFAKIEGSWAGGRQKTAVDRLTGAHAKKGSGAAEGTPNPLMVIPKIRRAVESITDPVLDDAPDFEDPRELKQHLRQIRAALRRDARESRAPRGGSTAVRD